VEFLDTLWVEKFRPKEINDLVLTDEHRESFVRFITSKEISNLLLSGPPGSGKTTIARILTSKKGILQSKNDNLLEINGSAKETRGISFVQDVIEPFLKIPPAGMDKHKIVYVDEADHLTEYSFSSLRHIIEKYSGHSRFIFTCNYLSMIPLPIQSRFQHFPFEKLPHGYIRDYCNKILEKENIEYDDDSVKFIIDNLYPDVRRIVNTLQRDSSSGKLVVDRQTVFTTEKKISSLIVEITSSFEKGKMSQVKISLDEITKLIYNQDLEFRGLYTELFFMKGFPTPAKIIVNKYSNSHKDCLVPQMHFIAMVFEIIKVLQDYKKASGK